MPPEEEIAEGQIEGVLVFIARKLADAQRLEGLLAAAGVDYTVEADTYTSGTVFRSSRIGAFFYVDPVHKERAVAVMLEHGYVPAQ